MESLLVRNAFRSRGLNPVYSKWIYDQENPLLLVDIGLNEWINLSGRLDRSLQNAVVQVPLNLHLDDASMVNTKMWKSASVVTMQISGAPPGYKGG